MLGTYTGCPNHFLFRPTDPTDLSFSVSVVQADMTYVGNLDTLSYLIFLFTCQSICQIDWYVLDFKGYSPSLVKKTLRLMCSASTICLRGKTFRASDAFICLRGKNKWQGCRAHNLHHPHTIFFSPCTSPSPPPAPSSPSLPASSPPPTPSCWSDVCTARPRGTSAGFLGPQLRIDFQFQPYRRHAVLRESEAPMVPAGLCPSSLLPMVDSGLHQNRIR